MADFRALIISAGVQRQIPDVDSLIVGSGIKTAAGALSISSFAGATNLLDDVAIAAGKSLSASAGAGAVDLSGMTGTFKTPSGANTLSGDTTLAAGKNLSASAGAGAVDLSGMTGTFKTPSGANTLSGDTTLAAGKSLLAAAGAGAVDLQAMTGTFDAPTGDMRLRGNTIVQAGKTLSTTGTGNIDLPNNVSARFKVEGVSVGATVTAGNLGTLSDGSNADALHTHTTGITPAISATSGEAIAAGELVAIEDSGGSPRIFKADANGAGQRPTPIGIAHTTAGAGGVAMQVLVAGERSIPDAEWDVVPAVTDVGKRVYMSETPGNMTITPPSTAGSTVERVGVVTQGGAGAVKIVWQPGEPTIL
jgi:hypothetical protein